MAVGRYDETVIYCVFVIQLFRQRLSHNSKKAHTTMSIGIMGSNSLVLLGWGSRCLVRRKENEWRHLFVILFSVTLRYLGLQSIKCKTKITHKNLRHCCFHFYAFVRQLFSKQLLNNWIMRNQHLLVGYMYKFIANEWIKLSHHCLLMSHRN